MAGILAYSSNNSGGGWWLFEKDYDNLEAAGWTVHWARPTTKGGFGPDLKPYDKDELLLEYKKNDELSWLGAKATSCAKRFDTKEEGIQEWEKITKQDAGAEGCNCCGPPHEFTWYDDDGSEARSDLEITSKLRW